MVIGTAVLLLALQAHSGHAASGATVPAISNVNVSPPFFNPSLGQGVSIAFKTTTPGTLTVTVLDRDGFPIRKLPPISVAAAEQKVAWDGRDDKGGVVPDEAYSLQIELTSKEGKATYFPANTVPEMFDVPPKYYDRREATILYELPVASRVHVQAGQAVFDPALEKNTGPVLKTVVNRQPRAAGRVVEHWNGFDETGAVFVPALPHFVIGIACTPLPENSVIATGNRQRTFLTYVQTRQGTSLITVKPHHDHHHAGLTTLDDLSPSVTVAVRNGIRMGAGGCWGVPGTSVQLDVDVSGPTARHFRAQPGKLFYFDGTRRLKVVPASLEANWTELTVELAPGEKKILAVNWTSDYGPSAPGIVCIERTRIAPRTGGEGRP